MDLKSSKPSSILTDPTLMDKSRLGIRALLPCSQPAPLAIARRRTVKIEDVRPNINNSWVDAMRASSPPRKKSMKSINFEVSLDDASDSAYLSWMKKYPSALDSFDKIMNRAKNSRLVIFLDYDGTLSPIVDDPDRAFMSADMRLAVRNVAKHFPTAIITGRSRDQVYELVGLTELYYAGSHGLDIMFPDSTNHSRNDLSKGGNIFQPARDFLPMIDEVFRTLVQSMRDIKGAKVENHKFCTSVHYRNVDEKSWPAIAQRVHDVLDKYPRLKLTHGRKVLEIRPMIDWDKGKAVEYLLESLGLGNKNDLLPIYIGDDRTDEDAFKVLQEGNRGYGIIVSSMPKESKAIFSLRDPSQVKTFLEALVKTKEQP